MAKRTAFIISTLTVDRRIQIKVLLCLAVEEVIIRFSKKPNQGSESQNPLKATR